MTNLIINNLDQLITQFRDFSPSLFTLVVTFGFLLFLFRVAKIVQASSQAFRLYFLSQFCVSHQTLEYGKWVVVTGATDGIGWAMAKEFAGKGHSIIIVGRSGEKLAQRKAQLEEKPNVGRVETIKIDLSDSSLENYERIRGQLNAGSRDIGILVNNAGMATDRFMRYADFEMDSIRRTVNVNVLATAYFTRMILPGMLARRRGLIINVSSLTGETQSAYVGVYAATKSFINGFSRTLQLEYASQPVTIINLTPGAVHTKMLGPLGIASSNLLMPSADYYARTAINAARTKISSFSGCWAHGLWKLFVQLNESLGLMHGLFLIFIKSINQTIHSKPSPAKNDKLI